MVEPKLSRRQVVVGGAATVAAAAGVTAVAAKATRPSPSAGSATAGEQQAVVPGTTLAAATPVATTPPPMPTTAAAPLIAPITVPPATLPAPGAPAAFVNHGPVGTSLVALTYHAAGESNKLSRKLLDVMRDLGVTATIFGVGDWMKNNPDIVATMVDAGHEMGNHTWSHQPMRKLSGKRLLEEIRGCSDVLTSLTGSQSRWFRPSGIEVPTDAILEQAGKAGYQVSVGYDVDSLDFQDPPVDDIVANVNNVVTGGSIVSLHFGHEGTIPALPRIVEHIRSLGLTPTTVGQLLG